MKCWIKTFLMVFCFTTVSPLAALQTHSAWQIVSCSSRTPHSHIHHRGTAVYTLNTVKMSGVFLHHEGMTVCVCSRLQLPCHGYKSNPTFHFSLSQVNNATKAQPPLVSHYSACSVSMTRPSWVWQADMPTMCPGTTSLPRNWTAYLWTQPNTWIKYIQRD